MLKLALTAALVTVCTALPASTQPRQAVSFTHGMALDHALMATEGARDSVLRGAKAAMVGPYTPSLSPAHASAPHRGWRHASRSPIIPTIHPAETGLEQQLQPLYACGQEPILIMSVSNRRAVLA